MEVRPELLVVLTEDADFLAVVEALRGIAPVTQTLPPRLALLALPPDAPEPALPGTSFHQHAPPAALVDRLTAQERLFVAAWVARHETKRRPGDTESWDAAGRQPPDRPVHGLG